MDNNFKMKNMKVYKMSLTTLSPIFIGSGEVLNKSSYFSSDKEVNVIDEEKLIKALYSRRGLFEEFISDCSSGNFSLTTFLDDRLPHYKKMDIAKYKLISHSNILTNNIFKGRVVKKLNDINVFIKSSEGKPYIPGSSIKGAIRTALIASEIRKNKRDLLITGLLISFGLISGCSDQSVHKQSSQIKEIASKEEWNQNIKPNDIVITLGAGTVTEIGSMLLK